MSVAPPAAYGTRCKGHILLVARMGSSVALRAPVFFAMAVTLELKAKAVGRTAFRLATGFIRLGGLDESCELCLQWR